MKRRRLKFSEYYNNIILTEIAHIYDVDIDKIFLGSRKKNIIHAKRMYIYILREMFDLTLKEISRVTNLHHASVIHHTRQFEFFYNHYNKDLKEFERIENRIIEVEIDEEIEGLEKQLKSITEQLEKLYKINKFKHEREKRENLLTE
jgi:hypothetical protein